MSGQDYQQSPIPPTSAHPRADSTDTVAMVIEIIFGLFGVMGMGWIYVGNFPVGIGLFIGWLIVVLIAFLSPTLISALTLGLGVVTYCCLVFLPPAGIAAAIVSGIRVKDYVRNTGARGSALYLIIAAVIGFTLICLAITIPLFALGGLTILGGALEGY